MLVGEAPCQCLTRSGPNYIASLDEARRLELAFRLFQLLATNEEAALRLQYEGR